MFKLERDKRMFSDELISAMETGSYEKLKQFVDDHPTRHLVDSEGTHLLHLAAKYNVVDLITYLIQLKCIINVNDSTGATPYKIAKIHNNVEAARILAETNIARFKRKIISMRGVWTREKYMKIRARVICKFYKRMKADGMEIEELGNILATCTALCEVVRLNDPLLTKAALQSPYEYFDCYTKGYEKHVIKRLDLAHIKVLFYYGSDTYLVAQRCLTYVMTKMPKFHASEEGSAFLKKLLDWEIINEKNLHFLESALTGANIESIEIFLQYNFHEIVKEKCGRDLLACLYGNRNPKVIRLLKSEDIDVDGRGSHYCTPLHYAASNGVLENVEFLLERGASIGIFHDYRLSPLYPALLQMCFRIIHHITDNLDRLEQCLKRLMQSGGNLLLTDPSTACRIFEKVFSDNIDFPKNTVNILVTHVAACDALGVSTKEYDEKLPLKYRSEHEELRERCRRQSKLLESHEICDFYRNGKRTKISMLTILVEDPRKLAFQVKRKHLATIKRFMSGYSEERLHEHYLDALEEHVKIIEKVLLCREAAARLVSECSGISDPNNLIIEQIVGYLSFRDLLTFGRLI